MKPIPSLLALVLLLAGCSGQTAPPTATNAAPTPAVSSTPAPAVSGAPATPAPSPTPTPSYSNDELVLLQADRRSPEDPNTPEFLDQAHDLCSRFANVEDEDIFGALKDADEEQRLTTSRIMIVLCKVPRYIPLVAAAAMPESIVSGTYYVGTSPGELAPGNYKTIGAVQDCYWVKKDEAGEILDNDSVENAPGGVRITVKPSDYEVTMNRCGIWIPHEASAPSKPNTDTQTPTPPVRSDETMTITTLMVGETAHLANWDVTVLRAEQGKDGISYGWKINVCYVSPSDFEENGRIAVSDKAWSAIVQDLEGVEETVPIREFERDHAYRPDYLKTTLALGECNLGWLGIVHRNPDLYWPGIVYQPSTGEDITWLN